MEKRQEVRRKESGERKVEEENELTKTWESGLVKARKAVDWGSD